MSLKRRKILKGSLAAVLLLLLLIVAGLLPVNLWFAKNALEQYADANFDTDIRIQGPLRLRLGPNARLSAALIEVRKSSAADESLAQVGTLIVMPRLLDLLRGDIHIQDIEVRNVEVDYCAELPSFETSAADDDAPPDTATPSIAINSFALTNLRFRCQDQSKEQLPTVVVQEAQGSARAGEAIAININGQVVDTSFRFEAQGGSLDDLMSGADEFPLHMLLTGEGLRLSLDGEMNNAFDEFNLRVTTSLSVQEPHVSLANFDIEIPAIPDLEVLIDATLSSDAVDVTGFEAKMGVSDVSGTASARFASTIDHYEVDAHSGLLDLTALGLESDQSDDDGSASQVDFELLFDALSSLDARARLSVGRLRYSSVLLEGIELDADLSGGLLNIPRVEARFNGASINATASLDLQSECEQLVTTLQASGVDLQRMAETLEVELPVEGSIDSLKLRAQSCGNSAIEHRNTVQLEIDAAGATVTNENLGGPVLLDRFSASAGWSSPARTLLRGRVFDEKVSIDMQGSTVQRLLAGESWPLSVEVRGAGTHTKISGVVAVGDSELVDLHVAIEVPRAGSLHRFIDVEPTSELPLSAQASVYWDSAEVRIDELGVDLGQSTITGRIASVKEGQDVILDTRLRSKKLDLRELEGLLIAADDSDEADQQAESVSNGSGLSLSDLAQRFPSAKLDVYVEHVQGARLDIREIQIKGGSRDRFIDDASVSMRVDDVLFMGVVDLDLRSQPGQFSYHTSVENMDVGHLLRSMDVAIAAGITAELMTIDHKSSGESLQEYLATGETRVKIRNLNWLRDGRGEESGLDLSIAHFEITARPNQEMIWDTRGTLNGIPLAIRAETPRLADILYGDQSARVQLAVHSQNIVGMLDGVIDWSDPEQFVSQLMLSGQRVESETVDLSLLEGPLAGAAVSADLNISEHEIAATNLSATLGTSSADGNAVIRMAGPEQEIELRLHAPHIQTLDLVELINSLRADQSDDISNTEPDEITASVGEQRDIVHVIRDYIDAQTQGRQFDVQIEVDKVYAGDYFMGGAQIGLFIDSEEVRLQPFTVSLPSGDINVEYIVEQVIDGYEARLRMDIEHLQYGDLVQLYVADAPKKMRGLVYLDTELTASAPSVSQLGGALEGKVNMLVVPEDIKAGVLDLWAGNLVLALLTPKDSGTPKKLNCLVAKFAVDEGVMKSKLVMLDSTDVIVRVKGEIDIPNRTIDIVAAPQAKLEKLFSMSAPIVATGPWDDMQIGLGGGGFVGTLFRWYMTLIYVPYKWITGERFPADGLTTCFGATDWELPSELTPANDVR
jgi:uncharacterized protein involved in outer membrane biogenesis